MTRARLESQWAQTAQVLALTAECHRNPRKRSSPFTAAGFNPFTPKPTLSVERLTAEILMVSRANRPAHGGQ